MRVHERLIEEFPDSYDCSYPLVQRYIKARKATKGNSPGFLELVRAQGVAQANVIESLTPEKSIIGLSNWAAVSRMTCMDSDSSSWKDSMEKGFMERDYNVLFDHGLYFLLKFELVGIPI